MVFAGCRREREWDIAHPDDRDGAEQPAARESVAGGARAGRPPEAEWDGKARIARPRIGDLIARRLTEELRAGRCALNETNHSRC